MEKVMEKFLSWRTPPPYASFLAQPAIPEEEEKRSRIFTWHQGWKANSAGKIIIRRRDKPHVGFAMSMTIAFIILIITAKLLNALGADIGRLLGL